MFFISGFNFIDNFVLLIELIITFFHKSALDNDICNSVRLVRITYKFKYKYFSSY